MVEAQRYEAQISGTTCGKVGVARNLHSASHGYCREHGHSNTDPHATHPSAEAVGDAHPTCSSGNYILGQTQSSAQGMLDVFGQEFVDGIGLMAGENWQARCAVGE